MQELIYFYGRNGMSRHNEARAAIIRDALHALVPELDIESITYAPEKVVKNSTVLTGILNFIRQVIHKMIPYRNIEQVEHIESPLSPEMVNALDLWYQLYRNKAPWLGGEAVMNPRAQFLKEEFAKIFDVLRLKLEQGCAAGGMTIRPFPMDGHFCFDWTMAWSLYPLAFGSDGGLTDVIFRDVYTEGKIIYTRLERHTVVDGGVKIRQRAFQSMTRENIGTEIPLTSVRQWAMLQPEVTVTNTGGQLFGWYKVASANHIDADSPMGASVYAKAVDLICQADQQYSRLLWEYEGSELAIDVDPTVLRPSQTERGKLEMPKLNQRLFRAVDAATGDNGDRYSVFSPAIRDANYISGLNQLLIRIENLCGLSRGCISDVNAVARTATELRIIQQRSYDTIADNQKALERCLRDVARAMDKFATLYQMTPEGDYDLSFEWDDSIITDRQQQVNERLTLLSSGLISKREFRQWYFGETETQARAAIETLQREQQEDAESMLPALNASDV